jgi:hypothetical protein
MADPSTMAAIGIGSTVLSGLSSAAGAEVSAKGKQLDILGSMYKTVGQAFGFQVQAQQAQYQANVDDYQAAVAEMNRQIAEGNAEYARATGETEASIQGLKTQAQVATTKVAQAASGLDINTGSAVSVRSSEIELGQFNESMIRSNAAKVAYNYQVEATQDSAQRDLYTYASAQEKTNVANDLTAANMTMQAIPLEQQAYGLAGTAGDISAFGSIASTTASVASKWQTFSQA